MSIGMIGFTLAYIIHTDYLLSPVLFRLIFWMTGRNLKNFQIFIAYRLVINTNEFLAEDLRS